MRVLICGATGSIGQQALKLLKVLKYQLVGISFYKNYKLAQRISTPYFFSPIDHAHSNVKSYDELIKKTQPDLIVNAVVGIAGLEVTLLSIENKIDLALANKESLVVAGQFVRKLAKVNEVNIYPIDSEHSGAFAIIQKKGSTYERVFITASGGPFYHSSKTALAQVKYQQAIKHPKWNMGEKISVDSATLMNKCFELIEAYWYFNTTKVLALYHPQVQVHAIVEYKNNSYAFISPPNMEISIKLALTKFRDASKYIKVLEKGKYQLETINPKKYWPIELACQILRNPRTSLPNMINAANEQAIILCKNNIIKFSEILTVVKQTIKHFPIKKVTKIQEVYEIDKKVREYVKSKWNHQ